MVKAGQSYQHKATHPSAVWQEDKKQRREINPYWNLAHVVGKSHFEYPAEAIGCVRTDPQDHHHGQQRILHDSRDSQTLEDVLINK